MSGAPWLKLYTEILDDVKLARLTDAQKWRFVQLLALAGECDAAGDFVTSDSHMTVQDIAWRLRCDIETLQNDIAVMLNLSLLNQDGEVLSVAKWTQRQGPAQEDKRKSWRARQEKRRNSARQLTVVTHANVTRDSPVTHANVTPLEEEEDIDQESEEDSDKEAEEESPKKPATPPTSPPTYPVTPLEAEKHPDINLFRRIAGKFPGQAQYRTIIDALCLLRQRNPGDDAALESYIRPFFTDWASRTNDAGQPYDPLNLPWLTEWAVNGHAPPRKPPKSTGIRTRIAQELSNGK